MSSCQNQSIIRSVIPHWLNKGFQQGLYTSNLPLTSALSFWLDLLLTSNEVLFLLCMNELKKQTHNKHPLFKETILIELGKM